MSTGTGGDAQTASVSTGGLSREMLLAILVVIVVAILSIAALVACRYAKRSMKSVTVSRPALRRQVTPEEERAAQEAAAAAAAEEPQLPPGDAAVTNVRMEDVRLVELGMRMERTRSFARPAQTSWAQPADISLSLDIAQAAIDEVREALTPKDGSPRVGVPLERRASSPRSPRATSTIDTRIRADPKIPARDI